VLTFAAAITIWLVVRDDPSERGFASYLPLDTRAPGAASMGAQVRAVLAYRNTWLLLAIPGAFSGIILTFPGLWGVPFLVTHYGFSTREAATLASAMLIVWSASSMLYGPLSQRMGRRKPVYAAGLVAITALWALVVFVPGMPRAMLVAVLLAVSVAAGAFIVNFAFAKESVPANLAGTVSGMANMGVMLGGMLMQPLVGFVLDARWDGAVADGARLYSFAAYQQGFALMLVWAAVALVLLHFTRETYCRGLR